MGTSQERREDSDLTLGAALAATVTFAVGADEVELDATVLRATARTVVVELASGVSALALATASRCELTMRGQGVVVRADARPGRRLDDVPESRQVELVTLDKSLDLRDVLG